MAEIKALVPTMTSNTTPSGTVISHLYNGKQYPTHSGGSTYGDPSLIYYAFDGNDSTCTLYNTENVSDGWIGYQFDSPVKANKIIAKIGNNLSTDSFEVHIQSYINNEWVDIADSFIVSGLPDGTYNVFDIDFYKTYQSDKFRIFTPTRKVPGTNLDIIDIQLYYFDPHLNSSGSTEAIRDWLNASFYNKEEIDELFIQSNQQGLIPYDLMITGDQPEQMIKLVGQTSGKTYNICLAAILGDDMKETVLWENSGSTRPSTITLNDDWTKYKWLIFCTTVSLNSNRYLETYIYPTSLIKKAIQNNSGETIALCFNANSSDYLWYSLSNNTLTYMDVGGNNPIPTSILGYS